MDATALLRPGLLADRTIAIGGGDSALAPPLAALGATTSLLPATLDEDAAADRARGLVAAHDGIDVLLHDLRPAFGDGGHDALRTALDTAWVTVRAVATTAFIPEARGGKVVLVAPRDDAQPAAAGVRSGAENLARTLSIEWARFGIRITTITPGAATTPEEVASVAAYLLSPAGDYFSGARLDLGA